jgi:hypothetical protein
MHISSSHRHQHECRHLTHPSGLSGEASWPRKLCAGCSSVCTLACGRGGVADARWAMARSERGARTAVGPPRGGGA